MCNICIVTSWRYSMEHLYQYHLYQWNIYINQWYLYSELKVKIMKNQLQSLNYSSCIVAYYYSLLFSSVFIGSVKLKSKCIVWFKQY